MIPVLGFAYISRSDLFLRAITSINHPVQELVIIDNSSDDSCPRVDDARHIKMYRNMGVSWAWNTIILNTHEAPYWIIANTDIKFAENDLRTMEETMERGVDLALGGGMMFFGISANCVQTVGWFDEMFWPAYCEDNDYVWRALKLGVRVEQVALGFEHFGSATLKSSEAALRGNTHSYPLNVEYYERKWGGEMNHEVHETPFNTGGSPRDTETLDLARVRDLSWG